jgi:hypothetical protein
MPSSQSRNRPLPASNWSKRSIDLLVDVLGDLTIAADQVVDQAEDVTDVALVHRVPRGSIAPGHRPDEAAFVVHLPVASVGFELFHHSIATSRRNPSRLAGKSQIPATVRVSGAASLSFAVENARLHADVSGRRSLRRNSMNHQFLEQRAGV